MILGGNHNEKKTYFDWSLFISISMTGMPGYWNDSFCSCVVQHLREPGCPYWFDGLGGSFSCRKVGRPNGDADCTWSAEKVLFGGFSRQSWWVWNQPYKQKAQGLFFLQISLEFSPQAMFLYHQAIPTMMNQLMFAVQYVWKWQGA